VGLREASPAAAFAATPASAQAYPTRNWTQTPGNTAGVVFHPFGDYFEIWDNRKDGHAVRVWWNYVGVNDRPKKVTSRGHYGFGRLKLAEYPHAIYFRINDIYGKSQIVKYRTWGS
jgi:hypothetical protein